MYLIMHKQLALSRIRWNVSNKKKIPSIVNNPQKRKKKITKTRTLISVSSLTPIQDGIDYYPNKTTTTTHRR
jgi:hypothetical protein